MALGRPPLDTGLPEPALGPSWRALKGPPVGWTHAEGARQGGSQWLGGSTWSRQGSWQDGWSCPGVWLGWGRAKGWVTASGLHLSGRGQRPTHPLLEALPLHVDPSRAPTPVSLPFWAGALPRATALREGLQSSPWFRKRRLPGLFVCSHGSYREPQARALELDDMPALQGPGWATQDPKPPTLFSGLSPLGGAGFGPPGQASTGGKGQAPKCPRHVRNKGPQEPLSHLSGLPRAAETEARADQGAPEPPGLSVPPSWGVTPLCGGGRPQEPDSRAEVSERAGLASLAGWREAARATPLVKPHGRRTVHLAEKAAWAKALGQGRHWCVCGGRGARCCQVRPCRR